MSSMSCAYTVTVTVDTPGNLIDIDADLLQLRGLRPDVAGVHVDDIPVNEHFPGIGGKVLRVELGQHFLLNGIKARSSSGVTGDAQQLQCSCSVLPFIPPSFPSRQGFGAFPIKQPTHGPQGQGAGRFFRLNFLACYVSFSPATSTLPTRPTARKCGIFSEKRAKNKESLAALWQNGNGGCSTSPNSFACSIFSARRLRPQ